MGNLRSVEKALERVGARPSICADPAIAERADGLILPGVGAFAAGDASGSARSGFDELIERRARAGAPVLGICLGFQLLFESLDRARRRHRARADLRPGDRARGARPQGPAHRVGAGALASRLAADRGTAGRDPVLLRPRASRRAPQTRRTCSGSPSYGERFACAVERPPLYGVQFHPEKSSAAGLRLLGNFAAICSAAARRPDSASAPA